MSRFLIAPQWQGSAASRAMLLRDGAHALAGDLPRAATTEVEVPLEAGESLDSGIRRLSALQRAHALISDALEAETGDEKTIVIGGDGSVTIPSLGALIRRTGGEDLALLWLGAHASLHTPASSPSGAWESMALRAAIVGANLPLALDPGLPPERVVLAGARAIDDDEDAFARTCGLTSLSVAALSAPDAIAEAVRATGARRVYVHVDVDVLDPAHLTGVFDAVPFGASVATLVESIGALRTQTEIAGATVAGFAPRTPDDAISDLGALLRIIGALA